MGQGQSFGILTRVVRWIKLVLLSNLMCNVGFVGADMVDFDQGLQILMMFCRFILEMIGRTRMHLRYDIFYEIK